MDKKNLCEKFRQAELSRADYDKLGGPGLLRKLRRVQLLKGKYIKYILARLGLLRKNARATLFWGKDIILPIADSDAAKLYFFGTLAKEESKLTKYLIRNLKEDSVFYDVGANYGFYTLLAKEIIIGGQVHSFEPSPEVFKYLKQVKGVKVNKIAVGNSDGKVDLFNTSSAGASGKSTISPIAAKELKKDNKKVIVDSIKLDTYIGNNQLPTFIKIDVEGAEHLVLNGAKKLLAVCSPVIALEIWGGKKGKDISSTAVDIMLGSGYKPFKITDDGDLEHMNSIDYDSFDNFMNLIFKK